MVDAVCGVLRNAASRPPDNPCQVHRTLSTVAADAVVRLNLSHVVVEVATKLTVRFVPALSVELLSVVPPIAVPIAQDVFWLRSTVTV